MTLPVAMPLAAVSPSAFKSLTECQLRLAFGQHAPKPAVASDPQIIGDALHATMASLVNEGAFTGSDVVERADQRFWTELTEQAPEREVAGARVASARLRKLVARVGELLQEAGAGTLALPEQHLIARGGALHGVVDLIIESDSVHAVVDYKTGSVVDEEGEVLEQYSIQLQLYAVLEQERSGSWPSRAVLLRGGKQVTVDVDPSACEQTAAQAVLARDAYNSLAGSVPPANANESSCLFCSFASRCPAFWGALSPSWQGRGAVRGQVAWAQASSAHGLTVGLDSASGTVTGSVVVRGIGESLLDASEVQPGGELVVYGVRPDRNGQLVPDKFARVAFTAPGDT
jgi:RecB family exonuclease